MDLRDKAVIITGAAHGIGAAMARRFAAEGAEEVVLADLDHAGAREVAKELGGTRAIAVRTDVTDSAAVRELVDTTVRQLGRVDLFCSNAGIATSQGLDATDEAWASAWSVNVLAHVYAARAVLPAMLRRGEGYLLQTCSAAGLLTSPGDAPYAATKHAAVALAEWLAVTYGERGIRLSALCPQGVRTGMLMGGIETGSDAALAVAAAGDILGPEQVADHVVAGLAAERFLILPHPEVATFVLRKAQDRDRWIAGMRRLLTRR